MHEHGRFLFFLSVVRLVVVIAGIYKLSFFFLCCFHTSELFRIVVLCGVFFTVVKVGSVIL